jgi:hypothetical protein
MLLTQAVLFVHIASAILVVVDALDHQRACAVRDIPKVRVVVPAWRPFGLDEHPDLNRTGIQPKAVIDARIEVHGLQLRSRR